MLNLIKADLYRITRPRYLRGELVGYGIAIAFPALFLLGSYVVALIMYPGQPISNGGQPFLPVLSMLYLTSRILPFLASVGILQIAFGDMQDRYARNLVSSTRGRLAYTLGRLLFTGIWAALLALIALATTLLALLIMSPNIDASFDAPASVLLWFAEAWLSTWAFCAMALVPALLTGMKPLSYGFAFVAVSGMAAMWIGMGGYALAAVLGMPAIAEGVSALMAWLPSTMCGTISEGIDALVGMGSAAPFLFAGGAAMQAAVVNALWIALAGIAAVAIAAKREV